MLDIPTPKSFELPSLVYGSGLVADAYASIYALAHMQAEFRDSCRSASHDRLRLFEELVASTEADLVKAPAEAKALSVEEAPRFTATRAVFLAYICYCGVFAKDERAHLNDLVTTALGFDFNVPAISLVSNSPLPIVAKSPASFSIEKLGEASLLKNQNPPLITS